MITGFGGLPGSGKTTRLARVALACLREAKYKDFPRYGQYRKTVLNIKLSSLLEEEYHGFYEYFESLTALQNYRDVNLLVDELAIYYPAREWDSMLPEHRRWLMKHRHYNSDIWFTVQDLKTVDPTWRRLTSEYTYFERIIATREPSPYKPQKKRPFIFTRARRIPRDLYEMDSTAYTRSETTSLFWFNRHDFKIFDTHQDLPPVPPPPLIRKSRDVIYIGGKKDGVIEQQYTLGK